MRMRFATWALVMFSGSIGAGLVSAQTAAATTPRPQPATITDGWGKKVQRPQRGPGSGPAPKHDIAGIWEPETTGFSPYGAINMPSDGKPEHAMPFTKAGEEAFKKNKPGFGTTEVAAALTNDPVNQCDPQGMPRQDLYELRTTEILQNEKQVVLLYTYDQMFRVIWNDGRPNPTNPEPRWLGYSTGKWADDTTFVATTNGLDDRTWIDNAGRPHSDDMVVEERFHRVDNETMEQIGRAHV